MHQLLFDRAGLLAERELPEPPRRRQLLTHAEECDLAFRWQHCRDRRCLHVLVLAFDKLVFGKAAATFRKAQLDKGVKVTDLVKARSADERLGGAEGADLAGHFKELLAQGTVGLLEAASLYNGQYRFSTYAEWWALKRMQEYVRANWNVVLMPEPAAWKVAKEDQIPATIPSPQLSPFENPYSLDKKAKHSRAVELAAPIDREDNSEENVVGRFGLNTVDYEQEIFGADHFEPGAYQSRAHESMEALDKAVDLEGMARSLDLRISKLSLPRGRFIIGLRFPLTDAKKWTRAAIGELLEITSERVRQIEEEAKAELTRGEITTCSLAEFWGAQPYWNKARLRKVETRGLAADWMVPKPAPKNDEPLIDKLVRLMLLVLEPKKRWLPPRILYEEDIAKPIRTNSNVIGQISRASKAASAANYYRQIGWDEQRRQRGEHNLGHLLAAGYVGNCQRQ